MNTTETTSITLSSYYIKNVQLRNTYAGQERVTDMYAFIALFDEQTEQIIWEIWRELIENSISFYGEEVKERRPHITIASYNHVDISEFVRRMDEYSSDKTALNITFGSIGVFSGSGTLFFAPTVTRELIDFHMSHHEHFSEFNDHTDSLYVPGRWVPHCTIANRLSHEKMIEAFSYCVRKNQISGKVKKVALMKVVYENGKCVQAPIVHIRVLHE